MADLEDVSDWEALRRFRALGTDAERQEQLLLSTLHGNRATKAVDVLVKKVDAKVDHQNGRVGKLETWRTQQTAIYAAILAAAPFVFFALGKLFGG